MRGASISRSRLFKTFVRRDPPWSARSPPPSISNKQARRRFAMTFQIFVGGQRVNSAEILDTPGWSAQVRTSASQTSTACHFNFSAPPAEPFSPFHD